MTIKNRLEKIENKTQADSNVDHEKLEELTALLRSLDGVEDPTKFTRAPSNEVEELATLLQRLDARHKLEYPVSRSRLR